MFVQVILHEMLLQSLSVYETLAACGALVRSITSMKIRMVGESTFLGKTFAADVARVRSLPRVDAHVSDESVVNSELTLTNLTAIGFLVGVGTVVQRQLVLFVEAGRAFVALELSLGMQVEVLNVLFLIQEAFSTLTALVGFDTVNTDHMGSELAAVAERGVTVLAVVFSFVEETTV